MEEELIKCTIYISNVMLQLCILPHCTTTAINIHKASVSSQSQSESQCWWSFSWCATTWTPRGGLQERWKTIANMVFFTTNAIHKRKWCSLMMILSSHALTPSTCWPWQNCPCGNAMCDLRKWYTNKADMNTRFTYVFYRMWGQDVLGVWMVRVFEFQQKDPCLVIVWFVSFVWLYWCTNILEKVCFS